jgi:plasmid stabilization system protein ParE
MNVRLLPAALKDLEVGVRFYDDQEPGIGKYYLDELFTRLRELESTSGIHRLIFGHHRCLASKFHTAIYYTLESDLILVRRILDLRRDPKWLRRQLSN